MRRPLWLLLFVPLLVGFAAGIMTFLMCLALGADAMRLALAAGLALLCGAGLQRLGSHWR
ncbi:MAG TPA: hypothetical protein VNF74_02245 [Terriglobales bacterium]|nr:hypothetical protein [Terriglobales bacterium]